jgi:hypothetical protein
VKRMRYVMTRALEGMRHASLAAAVRTWQQALVECPGPPGGG